jgi:hypothetical protein
MLGWLRVQEAMGMSSMSCKNRRPKPRKYHALLPYYAETANRNQERQSSAGFTGAQLSHWVGD